MSKDSKPTKKATVSKRRPMKKGTVSNDSKPAERVPCPTTANRLKRPPCPTTANLLKECRL